MSSNETNFLFDSLVKSEEDVLGMIAYSVYKRSKIAYIKKYQSEHQGSEPPSEDLSKWRGAHCTDTTCQSFVTNAEVLLNNYSEKLISSKNLKLKEIKQREQILKEQEEGIRKRDKELKEKERNARKIKDICPQKQHYFLGVSQSLVASFIWLLLSICIIFSAYSFMPSVKQSIDSFFKENSSSPVSSK